MWGFVFCPQQPPVPQSGCRGAVKMGGTEAGSLEHVWLPGLRSRRVPPIHWLAGSPCWAQEEGWPWGYTTQVPLKREPGQGVQLADSFQPWCLQHLPQHPGQSHVLPWSCLASYCPWQWCRRAIPTSTGGPPCAGQDVLRTVLLQPETCESDLCGPWRAVLLLRLPLPLFLTSFYGLRP